MIGYETDTRAGRRGPVRSGGRWVRIGVPALLVTAGIAIALVAMVNVSVVDGVAGLAGLGGGLFLGAIGEGGSRRGDRPS